MTEANKIVKLTAEIMINLKEYTDKEISDLEEAKIKIGQLLKTHRPIKSSNWEYGLNFKLKPNHRLIIKEESDKSKIREYSLSGKRWECLGCNRGKTSFKSFKSQKYPLQSVVTIYGIVFAPIKHTIRCQTKDYTYAMEVQTLLGQGIVPEAQRLMNLKRKSLNDSSNLSLSESAISVDESSVPATDNELDSSVEQSVIDESVAADTTPSESSTLIPTSEENAEQIERSNVKREMIDGDCTVINEPVAKKPKTESDNVEIFSFNHPSADTLKQICKKLSDLSTTKIEYNHMAYKFWGDIIYENITSQSANIKTHTFKSRNFFACFSHFFTGKSDSCFLLQQILMNIAFRDELISSGSKASAEIDDICTDSTVSNQHLEFICKFLSCRIGIFENGILKKIGTWETENSALTFMFLFDGEFFSVIIDLF